MNMTNQEFLQFTLFVVMVMCVTFSITKCGITQQHQQVNAKCIELYSPKECAELNKKNE